jgi:hypothetical protein
MCAAAQLDVPIVPTLEQMGALSSLLVHDLANHLCIISGNATYAELVLHSPERVAAAVHAIVQASELAGNVLGKAGEMRQMLSRGVASGDVAETIELLRRLFGSDPNWRLELEAGLSGESVVGAKWVALAVERVAAELGAGRGVIQLGRGVIEGTAGPRPCLLVKLAVESTKPFSIKDARATYDNPGLLAAFEVLRNTGGRIETGPSTPTQQEVLIRVPWVAAASD